MPTKDGWSLEREHDKITLGKKQYRNMEEWSRPCAVCAERFSIHTRAGATSSSFGLRTCKEHRGRVLVAGEPGELERLKMENSTMRQELDPIYARNRELFEENQQLKARLAKYELPEMLKNMPWEA